MTQTKELNLHELDAAWIIALWIAIHGGDPSPEVVVSEPTALAAAALASQLSATHSNGSLTFEELEKRLHDFGISVSRGPAQEPEALQVGAPQPVRPPRMYCFVFNGERICVQVPRPKAYDVA